MQESLGLKKIERFTCLVIVNEWGGFTKQNWCWSTWLYTVCRNSLGVFVQCPHPRKGWAVSSSLLFGAARI